MSVIEVNNLVTLQAMAALTDWSGNTYIQTADIDASPTQDVNYGTPGDTSGVGDLGNGIGEGFIPIGDLTNYFNTAYDGQGFKITGSYIDRPTIAAQAIFGCVLAGALIKNLTLENCLHEGYSHAGSLFAICEGKVDNCHASGQVFGNYHNCGGFFTKLGTDCVASNCTTSCDVTNRSSSGDSTGGFAAQIGGKAYNCSAHGDVSSPHTYNGGFYGMAWGEVSEVKNCHATGNVSGKGYTGGFAGWTRMKMISDCYSTGNVSGNTSNCGGFCGSLSHSADISPRCIERSYSTGNVNQNWTQTGGFAGSMGSGDAEINDCYCTGDVGVSSHASDTNGGFVGVGYDGVSQTITNCYSTGKVWSTHVNARGFAGASVANPTIVSCYYDQTLSGKSDNDGHGVPVLAMDEKASFANWDFNTVWKMLSVPMLRSLLYMNDAYSYGQNDAYGRDNNDAYGNGDNDIYDCRLNRVY